MLKKYLVGAASVAMMMGVASVAHADEGSDVVVKATPSGVGLVVGPATIKFSGEINAMYVYDSPSSNAPVVAGSLANTGGSTSSVRSGLLPSFLRIDVTTNQGGWDVGAHFGMFPGINSNGAATAFNTSAIDFRENYVTVGRKDVGSFTGGRALAMFGGDAILNDMTLLGAGTALGNSAPGNTTLGRIGYGYLYAQFQPQITYTTPSMGGLTASAGVFEPSNFSGTETNSAPQFQGKVAYGTKVDDVALNLSVAGTTQKHKDPVSGFNYTGQGIDFFAKASYGPLSLTGYYYTAQGLGIIGQGLVGPVDSTGKARNSAGYYVQAFLQEGKLGAGISYGQSTLDRTANDPVGTLVQKNSSIVGQVRYGLTSWVTLIGEYTHSQSKADNGNTDKDDGLALGAILFF